MKVILAIVLIGVIALGFWLLDWQKKINDRQQLDQQIISKQQDYERIKEETRSLTALVQQNEMLNKEYQAVVQGRFKSDKAEAPEAFVPDFIVKLEALVAQVAQEKSDSGLEINAISPGGATTGADPNKQAKKDEVPSIVQTTLERFPKRKFQLTMHARYDTVIYFLDKLGNLALDRLVTLDHITLAPLGEKDAHPELTVTLPLTAYLKTSGGQ
jgi:Tfp pilus assembly protein PilO